MKPSHYADKMPIMELEKSRKREQKPPNHPAKTRPRQQNRAGLESSSVKLISGVWSGSVSGSVQPTVAGSEETLNTTQWIRCAQTNYKPNSTFFLSYFLSYFLSFFGKAAVCPSLGRQPQSLLPLMRECAPSWRAPL